MERGWWHFTEDGPHEDDWRDPHLFRALAARNTVGNLPDEAREALAIFGVVLSEILPGGSGDEPPAMEAGPGNMTTPREHARP